MPSFDENDVEQPLITAAHEDGAAEVPGAVSVVVLADNHIGSADYNSSKHSTVPVAKAVEPQHAAYVVENASRYQPLPKPAGGIWKSKYVTVAFVLTVAMVVLILVYFEGSNSKSGSSNSSDPVIPRTCPLPDDGWTAPDYANTSAFYEECVLVTTTSSTNPNQIWTMSGALTVPHGSGPFPAILILGGSGPTDMDGTAFQHNKAYKDLAWGLASKGVVVLRVNKRTYQFGPQAFPNNSALLFTFADEYTNDALSALDLLSTLDFVDPGRIILGGHSLGGEVAPGVAQIAGSRVKGLVLLAATPQSLPDLLPWQYYYLYNFSMTQGLLAAECRDLIQNETLTPDWIVNCYAISPSLAGFSMYGNYYLSERAFDPPTDIVSALSTTVPVFLLQGTADYNVPYDMPASVPVNNITSTVPTFQQWMTPEFASNPNVTWKVFDGLSHYFMSTDGPGGPTVDGFATVEGESVPSNVQQDVIDSIITWIQQTNFN